MRVEQVFAKPGRYKPRGKNAPHELTREEIKSYVDGTQEMIRAGYKPPVLFAHAAMLSDDGAPRPKDTEAAKVKNGAGWLEEVRMGSDGSALAVLEVTDSEAARKIQEGSIKFTSPEYREVFRDGSGRIHSNVIAHVALTHKPVDIEQGAMQVPAGMPTAMQFSLDDIDDEEKDGEKPEEGLKGETVSDAEPEKPANPDLPNAGEEKDGEGSDDAVVAQRVEAIVAHLAELGIELPADTPAQEILTILDRMLTGLKTAAAVAKKTAAENAPEPEVDKPPVVEERGVMQYSLSDVEGGAVKDKLLVKVIRGEADSVKAQLSRMVARNKITPAAMDKLLSLDGVMQFSTDGDLVPTLSIKQIAALLDECLPDGMAITEDQIATQYSTEDHPEKDQWFSTSPLDGVTPQEELTAEQKAQNDRIANRNPGMFAAAK